MEVLAGVGVVAGDGRGADRWGPSLEVTGIWRCRRPRDCGWGGEGCGVVVKGGLMEG